MDKIEEAYSRVTRGLVTEAKKSKLTPTAFVCMKTSDKSSNADLVEAAEEAGFEAKYVKEARVPGGAKVAQTRETAYFIVAAPEDLQALKSFVVKQWGSLEKAKEAFAFAIVPTASFSEPFIDSASKFFN